MIDLHLHSLVSDGVAQPGEVVKRAAAAGLKVVAIADHDDASGTAEAAAAAKEAGIALVPAIELTAAIGGTTVHVLGYGIDPAHEALAAVAKKNRLGKRRQAEAILAQLRLLGIKIEDEEVGLDGQDRYIGRNRIASALVVRGLAKDRLKAFKRYLNPGARAWAPVEVAPAADVVAAIRSAGGVAVLAHPTEEDLERHLGPLCDLGVDGIEVWRPKALGTLLHRIEKAREKRALLGTGGSDWHGLYPSIPLGDWKVQEAQVAGFLDRIDSKVRRTSG